MKNVLILFIFTVKANLSDKWTCSNYMLSALPFHGQCDLDFSGLSIASDEIQNSNEILETKVEWLSETWMKDNKDPLECLTSWLFKGVKKS